MTTTADEVIKHIKDTYKVKGQVQRVGVVWEVTKRDFKDPGTDTVSGIVAELKTKFNLEATSEVRPYGIWVTVITLPLPRMTDEAWKELNGLREQLSQTEEASEALSQILHNLTDTQLTSLKTHTQAIELSIEARSEILKTLLKEKQQEYTQLG